MTALTGQQRKNTYKDLLQVSNSNSGIDGTLRAVSDGEGTASKLELSSSAVNVSSGFQLGGNAVHTPLEALGQVSPAANKFPYFTSGSAATVADISAFGRSLIDDAAASNARTTLGLDSMATQAAGSVSITGGSISGITDLAIADGGTGASSAAAAFSALKQAASDSATGVLEIAVQSEMETGSSTSLAVTPGRQQYHDSAGKLWGYVDRSAGTPSLQSPSYNITSVADDGAANTAITIATNMSSAVYAPGICPIDSQVTFRAHSMAAGAFDVEVNSDTVDFTFWAFGDQ